MTSLSRRTAWATLAASAALSALVSATPLAALTPGDLDFRQAVAEQSAEIDAVAAFYRERDFAPLWTTAADAGRRQALSAPMDRMAGHGLRVIGVAKASFQPPELPGQPHEFDFEFLGLLGLADRVRVERN